MARLIIVMLFIFPGILRAETLPLFAKKYERSAGKPVLYTENLEVCNTSSAYAIIVENGDVNGKNRISSASITINGREIVGERDFNQKVFKIEKPVALLSENAITVKLASAPNGFIKVNIVCAANCFDVEVASPNDGSLVSGSKTIVKGRLYNAAGEAGVAVTNEVTEGSARFLAQREGENFACVLPLAIGANKITASATDACGLKAIDAATVNAEPVEEKIRLTIVPSSGVLSVDGKLDAAFEANAHIEGASNYAWDFEGDGVFDETGGGLSKVIHSYEQTGLYFPAVKVSDANGNAYMETGVVAVMSREEVDRILKGKWGGMRDGLANGNTEKASRYFIDSSWERYKDGFGVLKRRLTEIFNKSVGFALILVTDNMAKYDNLIMEDDGNVYSYPVIFVQDEDGIWRIKSF